MRARPWLSSLFDEGGPGLAVEVGQRQRVMGTTLAARMVLRIRYTEPARWHRVRRVSSIGHGDDYREL